MQQAMKKCRLYLLGLPHFELVIDHKPLVPILNNYTSDVVENARLQRLKEVSLYVFVLCGEREKITQLQTLCHALH